MVASQKKELLHPPTLRAIADRFELIGGGFAEQAMAKANHLSERGQIERERAAAKSEFCFAWARTLRGEAKRKERGQRSARTRRRLNGHPQ